MNRQTIFRKKVAYMVTIGLLLLPLFWLGHPATKGTKDAKGSPGGKLAQLRTEYGLSNASIGEIDPAGETIKLATLGLRPFAVSLLLTKANEYKKRKDFNNLSATLNQIARLQPNFIRVWRFQAWNLAYNVSVEFDDFNDRYHWVIRGIEFLKEGTTYNERDPRLLWDIGWFISHKIGRCDEQKQFRKLFKEDDEFHGSRPLAERDNWLVGKEWFRKAENMVDTLGVPVKGKSPLLFRSEAPMCQMNYAEALEQDGVFGEVARQAWRVAEQDWDDYGSFDIPTTYGPIIHLNDKELYEQRVKDVDAKIDALQPGLREEIHEERLAAITKQQLQAFDTPEKERTQQQHILAAQAKLILDVTQNDVARRIKGAKGRKARELAKLALEHKKMIRYITNYRSTVNFDYWRLRAKVEQTDETLAAREFIYKAQEALADADLEVAATNFDKGFLAWRKVIDKFPAMGESFQTGDDLMDAIRLYVRLMEQRNRPVDLGEGFILYDIIEAHGSAADQRDKRKTTEDPDALQDPGSPGANEENF